MAAKGLWVVLNVDNVEKSVEFYKGLGLKVKAETMEMPGVGVATMGTLEMGDSGLIFWGKHNVPADQPADTKAWVSGELGKGVLVTLGVRDATKLWPNAQKIGAQIESPLEAQPWGGHGFNLVDLDGYVVNVTDKFPGEPPKRKAAKKAVKRAVKKVAGKAKRAAGKVAKRR